MSALFGNQEQFRASYFGRFKTLSECRQPLRDQRVAATVCYDSLRPQRGDVRARRQRKLTQNTQSNFLILVRTTLQSRL